MTWGTTHFLFGRNQDRLRRIRLSESRLKIRTMDGYVGRASTPGMHQDESVIDPAFDAVDQRELHEYGRRRSEAE